MELLYSNILPVGIEEGQTTISDAIKSEFEKSDMVEIAVGYQRLRLKNLIILYPPAILPMCV